MWPPGGGTGPLPAPPPHPGLTMESMGAPMVGECWPSPHPAAPADVSGTELSVLLVA